VAGLVAREPVVVDSDLVVDYLRDHGPGADLVD
jgi:hypothetical protein